MDPITSVADSHSDLVVDILRRRQQGESRVFQSHHATDLNAWNVRFLMLSTGGDGPTQNLDSDCPLYSTILRIQALLKDIEESHETISLCTSTTEAGPSIDAGRIAAMLMIEGASPLRGSLECLDILYRLGIRSVQLTWNARNEAGDGCGEEMTGSGLTRFGRRLVEALNTKGMLVDVSHASQSLFYSVCENTARPFIVSHANAKSICDHPRNLTDDQIKWVGKLSGVIGLCYFPWFIDSEKPSIDRLVDHLDHIVDLIGISHICIGADFIYYATEVFSRELSSADSNAMYSKGFDIPGELATPEGFAMLMERMSQRGYSDEDIHKVFFSNVMDIYNRTIG